MRKKTNPELNVGDRIILVHMEGESLGTGYKGKVIGVEKVPNFGKNSSGIQYRVIWYDEDGNEVSNLSLMPEIDTWVLDDEFNENLNEMNYRELNDIIKIGSFLSLFTRKEIEEVGEFFELERRLSTHNMALEGGKFLLTGPSYIQDYFKLQKYSRDFDEDEMILIEKLIARSNDIRNLFIRKAIKFLENENKEPTIQNVQGAMIRLANTAKVNWITNANKFTNKEIE